MTSIEEINAQIEEIRRRPDYIKLMKMSRGPQEAAIFADYELKIRTLMLRRDELLKREPLRAAQMNRHKGVTLAKEGASNRSIAMPLPKLKPDPEPPRQALFTGGRPRLINLRVSGVPRSPQTGELPVQMVVAPNPVPPEPVDTSMPMAAGATPASVARAYSPLPKTTASQGPAFTNPPETTTLKAKVKAAGRITRSPSATRSVTASKTLQSLQVNEPTSPPQREMRKPSLDDLEDDGISLDSLGLGSESSMDNIILDLEPIGEPSDPEDEERPITPPPVVQSTKKRTVKAAARKK